MEAPPGHRTPMKTYSGIFSNVLSVYILDYSVQKFRLTWISMKIFIGQINFLPRFYKYLKFCSISYRPLTEWIRKSEIELSRFLLVILL